MQNMFTGRKMHSSIGKYNWTLGLQQRAFQKALQSILRQLDHEGIGQGIGL